MKPSTMMTRRTALASLAGLTAAGLLTTEATSATASGRGTSYPGQIALPRGFQPEGITSYGTYFAAGSMHDGSLLVGDLTTGQTTTLLPALSGRQIRGLSYDSRSGLLWGVGNVGTAAFVGAVDARTGTVAGTLEVPGGMFLNDLTIDRAGVWVTDSLVDRLVHIPLDGKGRFGAMAARFVALTGAWPQGDGKANNANGIRYLPGGYLLLNNSRVGGLWVVDERTGTTTEVPVSGSPALTGGDGLERVGSTVYDVRGSDNDSVTVLRLTGSGPKVTARVTGRLTSDALDVPSTATAALGALYAVNARFGVASPTTADYSVVRLPLR